MPGALGWTSVERADQNPGLIPKSEVSEAPIQTCAGGETPS